MTTTQTHSRAARAARTGVASVLALAALATGASAATAATGIDVSGYQHPYGAAINWSAVNSSGVDFTYIKATEGNGYANPYLAGDRAAAKDRGLFAGAYHYARPSNTPGSAAAQARFFVSKAGTARSVGDLPLVLDLETTGGLNPAALQTWTRTFLQTVQVTTGRKPMIYTAPYFWRSAMANTTAFTSYPLWIANYGVSRPNLPGGWTTYAIWQKSASGSVAGISGAVDLNVWNGSDAALAAFANVRSSAGTPAPTAKRGTGNISLRASRMAVKPKATLVLTGRLTSTKSVATANRPVEVWARNVGQTKWYKVAVTKTGRGGYYAAVRHPGHSVTYATRFPGASNLSADNSNWLTVKVG